MAARPKLNVQTPGEEPAASDDTAQPAAAASPEVAASESTEAAPDPNSLDAAELAPKAKPVAAPAAARAAIPDQSAVDPATIPYGKTVFTKQGHVCSTAPDPKRK